MENTKKMAAAISSVMRYIQTEEEAIFLQSLAAPSVQQAPDADTTAITPVKLWGVSGRQAQMQMRNMMQMKTFV